MSRPFPSPRRNTRLQAGALAAAVAFLGCAGDGGTRPTPQTPLILVSIDTLRADHLSLYGYERPTSPNLEAFAGDAIVFDAFFSSGGTTLPAHLSMMTSLYPRTHWVNPHTRRALEEERVTLAEVLKAAGYSTAAFVDGGWMSGVFGHSQGFDVYSDDGGLENGRLENILPKVYRWLDEHHREKFFLFVHTYDVHSEWKVLPYECPDGYHLRYVEEPGGHFSRCHDDRCASEHLKWLNQEIEAGRVNPEDLVNAEDLRFLRALYDGCINYVDDRLAEFFDRLRQLGLYDGSLIVVTSDHGEEFLEHGLFLHSQMGYEEISHIPLLVKLPRQRLGGTRVPHMASLVDLMPTLLEILRLPTPPQAQGKSLLPAILRDQPVYDEIHVYENLRTARWKYLSGRNELYDLANDPRETTNVVEEHAGVAEDLRLEASRLTAEDVRLYEEFARQNPAGESVELSPARVRQLRALGYLQ